MGDKQIFGVVGGGGRGDKQFLGGGGGGDPLPSPPTRGNPDLCFFNKNFD